MILVTGGTGMLGAHLLLELAIQGKKVKALKRSISSTEAAEKIFRWHGAEGMKLFQPINWVEGDINDFESLMEVLEGVSHVYHSAAMVSFSPRDHDAMVKSNIAGTANLVNACLEKKITKLVHVSSVATLGSNENGEPVTEESKWEPSRKTHGYALSKFQSELEVWRGIIEGLNAVIVNPSVIIGPGNWKHGSPSMIRLIQKGLKFYTKGATGFVDVRDVVRCMIALMDSAVSGERFILNAGNVPYREFFKMVAKELGVPAPKWHASGPLIEIAWRLAWLWGKFTFSKPALTKHTARSGRKTTVYSSQKIKQVIGFDFIPIEQSIRDTCRIYQQDNKVIHSP